ncbi:MAG: hypothetical protein JWL59_1839 [Chthoniobacteraceae bacterium]|nr:hypothetical protein [Chthoniobacteraceae bacterium]
MQIRMQPKKMSKKSCPVYAATLLRPVSWEVSWKRSLVFCCSAVSLLGIAAEAPVDPAQNPAPPELIPSSPQELPLTETEKARKRMLEAVSALKNEPGAAPEVSLPQEAPAEVAPVVQATLLESLPRPRAREALSTGETLIDGVGGIAGNLISAPSFQTNQVVPKGFRFGKIGLRTSLGIGITSSNTIRPEPSADLRETYGTLTPNISAGFGDENAGRYLTLSSITGISYTTDRFRNVDEDLDLRGNYTFNRLRLEAGFSYSRLSGIDRDIGSQVTRDFFTGTGTVSYFYSPKTTMALELSVPIRRFSGETSSSGFTVTPSVDYKFSPRTTFGLEVAVGTLDAGGDTQVFERPAFRMSYNFTDRLSLRGSLGMEHRDSDDRSTNTPVFELGAIWRVRESTQISLTAERRVSISALQSAVNYTSTSVQLGLSQRLGSRFRGNAAIAYEDAVYDGDSGGAQDGRHDRLLTGQAGLAYILTPHVSIMLNGAAIDNRSNQQPFRTYQGSLQSNIAF